MDTAAKEKVELEADFQAALKHDGVTLNYQPIVSAATQEIVSVEALARWVHPTRGRIAPDTFIPIAEEAGLIEELGRRVLERACADARGWDPGIAVSVNISPHQFESETIVPFVKQALERTGLPPHRLHLEVTERVVIKNVECVFKQLAELRALGVSILIDDFGVGHSSLCYFNDFPFDKVKIDKTFIFELDRSRAARAIIEAVTTLSRNLSIGVVAEGVETLEQQALLTKLGCTHLQGHLFSRAVPAEEIKRMQRLAPGSAALPA
ncbi:putative bifunctional diguanylate cyclase/phosphodiesterase [Sphingomicrobium astaxanthinifaciens]|uniref:putative bifunctional diguanylate cyclase/phosphodiesterase n=1 Tax=Sphingomicrobium astaxanthinifaciens TaxID=1227949 RepID=UPI00223F7295|nr:EAL domain-containing protein [Sphingomicrobium astaxanthinifaciens]